MPPDAPAPVLFGKLPARGDFVRRGDPGPAVEALDALVQRALAEGRGADPPPADAAGPPLHRFVFGPEHGPDVLAGALRLSRDRVGRAYPLLAARQVDRRRLDPRDAPVWPLRWSPFLSAAADLVHAATAGVVDPDVAARWTDALPPLPEEGAWVPEAEAHAGTLRTLPARAFWAHLWGDADDGRVALLLGRLAALLTGEPPPVGLRFPLPAAPGALGLDGTVAVWVEACERLLRTAAPWPSLFWTPGSGGGAGGALVVFLQPPSPAALHALLVGADDGRALFALDGGGTAEAVRAALAMPPEFGRLLENPYVSLAELLVRLPLLTPPLSPW